MFPSASVKLPCPMKAVHSQDPCRGSFTGPHSIPHHLQQLLKHMLVLLCLLRKHSHSMP